MRRPTPQRPAAITEPEPERADVHDAALALYALHGILAALDWLDEGWLDDKVHDAQLKAARTHLLLAGRTICERTTERI